MLKGSSLGRCLSLTSILLLIAVPALANTSGEGSESRAVIVIGFVGGMRSPDDQTQGVVQIGNRLRALNCAATDVKILRHWHWRQAYKLIYERVDRNRDKKLSTEEIQRAPKIIVYGHSLGGWAVIKLSRRLEQVGIPEELTVQIDTVGIGDEVVPGNVKLAANFYQRTRWLLRGEKKIRVQDENRTMLAGNFLIGDTGHEALARQTEVSDFITDRVLLLCPRVDTARAN